jgi:uncharacterized membrane protein
MQKKDKEWVVCKVCGAKLKRVNLERHYSHLHPSEKVEVEEERKERPWVVEATFLSIFLSFILLLVFVFYLLSRLVSTGTPTIEQEKFLFLLLFAAIVGLGIYLRG